MNRKPWLFYTLVTTIFWGVWGAFSELPGKLGFPPTLGYVVWALTMLLPALAALKKINWRPDKHKKAVLHGVLIGVTGSAGQLVLFEALKEGPAYLIFPFVSLSPLITLLLSFLFLKERVALKAGMGILTALVAIPLLSYQSADGHQQYNSIWILLSLLVFACWGIQAYLIKAANQHMTAESIFFYMTLCSLLLIPFALLLTDFSTPINWGYTGPYLTAAIQVLNAIGALFIVYAFRYGKAVVVSPLINTGAPLITIVLSLILYGVLPPTVIVAGMILAVVAIFLLAV